MRRPEKAAEWFVVSDDVESATLDAEGREQFERTRIVYGIPECGSGQARA